MAIHEDGTMDVRIDGKIVRRRYSIDCSAPFSNTYITRMQTKYKPDLRPGEEVIFCLSDDVPTIVVGPVEPSQGETVYEGLYREGWMGSPGGA